MMRTDIVGLTIQFPPAEVTDELRDLIFGAQEGNMSTIENARNTPTAEAERDALRAQLDRLHTWDGLMDLLDEHWPEGMTPTLPDDVSRALGPRIVSLLRWVDALYAQVQRVRYLHSPEVITDLIEGDCALEACDHEEACPTTGQVTVCSECYRIADSATRYYGEEGFALTEYPCDTIRALDGAVDA